MRRLTTMREALADPLLYATLLKGASWQGWRVLLMAAAGDELTKDERVVFKKLTGRDKEPGEVVHEFIGIFGRRGGKSRAMAVFNCWITTLCDHRDVLSPGETGVALIISRDQRISKVILNYIEGILRATPITNAMIVGRTADTIELSNGKNIEVRPSNYKTLRGPTYLAITCDEIAFWFTSVDFANPDVEILAAVRPGLLTTRGPLILVSSVYAKRGELYDSYQRYYGPKGPPDILVAFGTSRDINPSLPQAEIDRAIEKDPVRNRAEYLSEWRSDVEGFIPREIVEACLGDYTELLPRPEISYVCFVDAASGVPGGDSFTAVVAHQKDDQVVVDAIREVQPPFSPADTIATMLVPLCQLYGITKITGDNYAGEYPKELVRNHGITYELSDKHKSDLYISPFLSLLNSRKITLPNHPRAIHQICSLERTVQRTGRDLVSHPSYGHDDIANAIAGSAYLANDFSFFDASWSWVDDDEGPQQPWPLGTLLLPSGA